jgi:predicted DNA-binding protein YlxM (UPF0122 family)
MHPKLTADSRPVPDFDEPGINIPGFAVKDDGTVLYWREQWKKWIPLKPKIGPGGFVKVRIIHRGKVREIGVARLVLRAFVGLQPIGCEPLHYPDPDPANNHLDNLRWAPKGTSKLGRILGPTPPPMLRGSNKGVSVLTESQIPEIRRMYRDGWRYKEIAADIGVSEEAVRQVLIGKTWSHVPDPEGLIVMRRKGPDSDSAPKTKLDWETVETIRRQHADGLSYGEIALAHDISKCTVRDIIKGRTWKTP